MKNGRVPMHFMRFAPSEYLDDPFVKQLYLRRDLRTVAFYSAFLFRSHVEGGCLGGDEGVLAAHLLMRTDDVKHGKAVCLRAGKLQEENGLLFHKRVRAEIEQYEALRLAASESGKRGAQARINKDTSRVPQADPHGYPKLETGGGETGGGEVRRVETGHPQATPPNGGPPGDPHGEPGELEAVQAEATKALTETSQVTGIPPDELLALDSRTPNSKSILNIANCDSVRWLRVLTSKLTERRMQFEAQQRATGPPPSSRRPTASEITRDAVNKIVAEEESRARSRDVREGTPTDRGSIGASDAGGKAQCVLPGTGGREPPR